LSGLFRLDDTRGEFSSGKKAQTTNKQEPATAGNARR
jgi:hypothetical protein